VILQLINANLGCRVGSMYVGCIFYADDILLLSASVNGLQEMLNICSNCGYDVSKSLSIAFGPLASKVSCQLMLGNGFICWSKQFKYLGVHFLSGKKLKIDIDPFKKNRFLPPVIV
jgi:hypothetical protein